MVVSVDDVINAACEHFAMTRRELLGPDRHKTVAFARHVAMYVCRRRLRGWTPSYPEIGRAFGDRDHTTVISAVRNVEHWVSCGAKDSARVAEHVLQVELLLFADAGPELPGFTRYRIAAP